MTEETWFLLAVLVGAFALLIVLINWKRLRFHPFVALLVVAVVTGLVAGEGPLDIAKSMKNGAGSILGNVGLTLALGTMLGRLLADSGATEKIAAMVIRRSTTKSLPWLMAAAAFVIGIPMFFEVGLIVLLPLVFSVAERLRAENPGKGLPSPYTLLAIPTIAALSTLHGMVPPHPGPLIAVAGLHADLGKTIIIGLACAIPTIILAGPVYGRWLATRVRIQPDAALVDQFTHPHDPSGPGPSHPSGSAGSTGSTGSSGSRGSGVAGSIGSLARSSTAVLPAEVKARPSVPTGWAIAAILVPVVLMLLRTVAEIVLPTGSGLLDLLILLGDPVIAMLVGFLFALFSLALARGRSSEAVRISVSDSLKAIASILLIIGAGGAFNDVLEDSGIGDAVSAAASSIHIPLLLLGWLLALALSTTTGSATVGIVAATGILAPMVAEGGTWHTSLIVVAIGAGSLGLNYVNHAGFWLVKESFGMSMGQAVKTQTVVQTMVSVLGLGMAALLWTVT